MDPTQLNYWLLLWDCILVVINFPKTRGHNKGCIICIRKANSCSQEAHINMTHILCGWKYLPCLKKYFKASQHFQMQTGELELESSYCLATFAAYNQTAHYSPIFLCYLSRWSSQKSTYQWQRSSSFGLACMGAVPAALCRGGNQIWILKPQVNFNVIPIYKIREKKNFWIWWPS